jgi:hypothetical protein
MKIVPGSTVAMPDEEVRKWATHYTAMETKRKRPQIELVKCITDFLIVFAHVLITIDVPLCS